LSAFRPGLKNSHIIALDIKKYISADQSADVILREIRRQGALSIACHSWKTLVRREKNLLSIRSALRRNVDVARTLFRNGSWAA
jgi:hypothetical protein